MTKKTNDKVFFVSWIIEAYKRKNNMSGEQVALLFMRHRISEWLYDNYDVLHTVSEAYVVNEIEGIIKADNGNQNS